MRSYEIYIAMSDDGDGGPKERVEIKHMSEYDDGDKCIADFGWCFGCALCEVLWSFQGRLCGSEFQSIFRALQSVHDDLVNTPDAKFRPPEPNHNKDQNKDQEGRHDA